MMRTIGRRLRETKSLRAFAFEVLIVVVGVLIALGAQQLVEEWTWQQKVAAGEQRLKDDADGNVYVLAEQILVAPCVDAQLARLDLKLRSPSPWTGTDAYPSQSGLRAVIRAPARTVPTDLWTTLGTEGTALHFDAKRVTNTAFYYEQLQEFAAHVRENAAMRASLDFLARPADLSNDTRAEILGKISSIRYLNGFQTVIATQILGRLHEMGRLKSLAALEADIVANTANPIGTVSVCKQQGLPFGDWKAALRAQIEEDRIYDQSMQKAPK